MKTLGLASAYRADNYALPRRDAVALRLIEGGSLETVAAQQNFFYVDVDGPGDLCDDMKTSLDRQAERRACTPFNQDDGHREFHVLDPDGTLVSFGEAIPE